MSFNLRIMLAAALLGFIVSAQAQQPRGPIESVPYSVIRTEQGYEERLYPPSTWVTTRIKHSNRDEVALLTFMKLFDYINEANVAKVKIPMTTPISMLAEPASGPDCTQTFTLSFYIPSALAKSPPTPLNPDVFVEQRPEVRVLVRTFPGFANEEVYEEEKTAMINSLTEADGLSVDEGGAFYTAGYDPPFKLRDRRNEIWLIRMEPNLVREMKRSRTPCIKST